eukprot:scaffold58799_cov28-Tisochrysis_lutea.AAC.1
MGARILPMVALLGYRAAQTLAASRNAIRVPSIDSMVASVRDGCWRESDARVGGRCSLLAEEEEGWTAAHESPPHSIRIPALRTPYYTAKPRSLVLTASTAPPTHTTGKPQQ